jgi:outer membrane lipoprotein carrier protein
MNKFLMTAAISCNFLVAGAQVKSDADAKKILDAVSAKFKSYKAVSAAFVYKVESAAGKMLSSKNGSVNMKGNKYYVSMAGQEIFCDGVTVSTYDKSANEVTITKVDNSASTITPQKLFTDFYDKDFLYKLNGEKKIGNKTLQEIEMTPNDKTKPFHKVYLLIDKSTTGIYSTKVLEKSGNRYIYTISSLNGNTAVADTKFIFDKKKYPNVEVVDLR